MRPNPLSVLVICCVLFMSCQATQIPEHVSATFSASAHTNNWAVLVCTSRFWFNYRHVANVLSLYHSVKRLGIPDSQIIVMLADDMPCNARNSRPGTVFNNQEQRINLYGEDVEVDYRGYDVTVENFVRVLVGRHPVGTPRSKRLMSDHRSNVLVYLTGHGGDGFLKFQDQEEITNVDLADAIAQMWSKRRYKELFVIPDSCQSASMYQLIASPNVVASSSSLVGEDSLSHHIDYQLGVYIIDRYTYFTLEFLENYVRPNSTRTLQEYLDSCPLDKCRSTVGVSVENYGRDPALVRVTDFFGSVRHTQLLQTDSTKYDIHLHNTIDATPIVHTTQPVTLKYYTHSLHTFLMS